MTRLALGPLMRLRGFAARLSARRMTYFIAHAYEDRETRQLLLDSLPDWIEPLVFAPITVTPDEHVSDHLIAAIENADGLIYLASPVSMAAFWPAFERRFAKRIGKTVLSFVPGDMRLAAGNVQTDLPVAPLWSPAVPRDGAIARETLTWMAKARSVEPLRYERGEDSRHLGETNESLKAKTGYGAPILLFVSQEACARAWPFDDTIFGTHEPAGEPATDTSPANEPVVAWIGRPDAGAIALAFAEAPDPGANPRFRSIVMRSAQSKSPLVLSDRGPINRNEADNLLVRLEYRAHQQRAQTPPTPAQIAFHDEARHQRQRLTRM